MLVSSVQPIELVIHTHTHIYIYIYICIYIYIYVCVYVYKYSFLAALGLRCCTRAFLWLWWAGATLRCCGWASHCGGFSCCRAQAVGARASVVVAHGLSCSAACGNLPGLGLKPMSPALADRFLTLRQQGSLVASFFRLFSHIGHYRILSRVPCADTVLVLRKHTEKYLWGKGKHIYNSFSKSSQKKCLCVCTCVYVCL